MVWVYKHSVCLPFPQFIGGLIWDVCLPVDMSICLLVYLSDYLSVGLSACQSVCLLVFLFVYLSVCRSVRMFVHLSASLQGCWSVYPSVCLCVCYLHVCLFVCLQGCLSVYLSVCLFICLFSDSASLIICCELSQQLNRPQSRDDQHVCV